jgi:hypothetical protein
MSLNPDQLRAEFLGLTVRHDDVPLPREDLALFFASVSERYGLNRLEFGPEGGATFSGPDGAEFGLRPSTTASCSVTGLGYREGVERVVGLMREAADRYAMGPMWIDDVTLVAVWDCELEETAREVLAEGVLRVEEERLELLGGDDVAFGLRLWRRSGDVNIECAIEPMHAEPTKLYLRLVHSQGDPIPDAGGLVEAADGLYEFLHGPLRTFLLARARR